MQSKAQSVADYLKELPGDRRAAISKVRDVIRKNIPKGYEEGMGYGMITWCVPHKLYPPGYHCNPQMGLPYASLASQKNYMSLYLMCLYSGEVEQLLRDGFAAQGKKFDAGKSCIRFKKVDDLPLDVIGQAVAKVQVADYISFYEKAWVRKK